MADDLHDVASYLNEMRICFLLLTGTVYIILAIYFVTWCVRRNRRRVNNPGGTAGGRRVPNHRWAELQGNDYENAVTAQTNPGQTASDDLVSVRSDGALPPGKLAQGQVGIGPAGASQFGMAGRGASNRQAAPTFMRHGVGMQNHSGTPGGGGGPLNMQGTGSLLGTGSSATTRLMADTDTGTAMVSTAAATKPSTPHLGHHQQQQHAQVHQQHSPHQQQQQQLETGTRPAGCLLNNIAEEREASGSNSAGSSNAGTMSTFGWRNKEKVQLERHELQSLTGSGSENL